MIKSKHTEGPWLIEEDDGSFLVIDQDGMKIAGTFGFCAPGREGQEAANARLIAKAPEMLEALKALVQPHTFKAVKDAMAIIVELEAAPETD